MIQKRKEKFGELLLDVAKYIITAVILTSLFQGVGDWAWYAYFIAMVAVGFLIWGSLQLFSEETDKGRKERAYDEFRTSFYFHIIVCSCNRNYGPFVFSSSR